MTLRRQVSLLLSQGHPAAWRYPIGRVQSEAYLAQERMQKIIATEGLFTFMAVSTVVGSAFAKKGEAKKIVREFHKMIEGMTNG